MARRSRPSPSLSYAESPRSCWLGDAGERGRSEANGPQAFRWLFSFHNLISTYRWLATRGPVCWGLCSWTQVRVDKVRRFPPKDSEWPPVKAHSDSYRQA